MVATDAGSSTGPAAGGMSTKTTPDGSATGPAAGTTTKNTPGGPAGGAASVVMVASAASAAGGAAAGSTFDGTNGARLPIGSSWFKYKSSKSLSAFLVKNKPEINETAL